MIHRDRMIEHVESLLRIDSESRQEKEIAVKLKHELKSLGAAVRIDDAGRAVQGNTGNLIALFPGNKPNIPPFLLSAHMDTVVPGKGVKPLRNGQMITTGGNTVLGGDDKSGLSIIMEVLRTIREKNLPHGDIEIVFSICEEVGLLGAKAVDPKQFRAKDGLVLDSEDAALLTTQGPAAVRMDIDIHGLEAHAGVAPERGLSAIKIVSDAIARMKLGRIDKETTANIGIIHGGLATNIIPKQVSLKGEARSLSVPKLQKQVQHMAECFEKSADKYRLKINGKTVVGKSEIRVVDDYPLLKVSSKSRAVQLARKAAKKLRYRLKEAATGGGSDANIYNRWNINMPNLGTGMRDIHTVKEWLDLDDFERAANLVAEMLVLHASI